MSKQERSKYKKYLNSADPYVKLPKTSKWRFKKKFPDYNVSENIPRAQSQSPDDRLVEVGQAENCTINDNVDLASDSICNDTTLHTSIVESCSSTTVSSPDNEDVYNEEEWYDCSENKQETWYHDATKESVWYASESEETTDPVFEQSPSDECLGDKPIYNGASITVAESAILLLSFALRHNITGECLSDLLTLISFHCLDTNLIHKSLYRFRAFFSDLRAPLKFHKYCAKCEFLLGDAERRNCSICECNLSNKENVSYFVEIPIIFQIQQLFLRSHFHQNLSHRFNRKKKNDENLEDIYDGLLYKKYSEPGGFLSNHNNISFMWYTDGVPLFKSSKISIWPLFLSINELPFNERMKQENMIFAGLWFGQSKPSMATFLKPFHDSLKDLKENGTKIECAHCSKNITVRGMLLCGTCDLPAKCMMMNMTQFNGKYGCPKCKQPGNVVKSGKGHTRVFPFMSNLVDGPKRSHLEFLQHGEEAYAKSEHIFGVKGPSWWGNICADIINGTAIDYMHSVLLGLVRRLLKLWFDPKFSSDSFSISNLVDVADKKLSSIKPPYYIHRHPRRIKDHAQYWKASECRAWLFFYSVPVLFRLLKPEVFQHYLLLVDAIYVLNLDSISIEDVSNCEELLIKFCCLFSTIYGEQHMSANLHQLLHLHDNVKQMGPLWVYSCFSFESLNGKLVKLFHGTQNPVVQIANAVSALLKLPLLADQIHKDSNVSEFYNKLTSSKDHFKTTEYIANGIYIIGSKHSYKLGDKYLMAVTTELQYIPVKCYMFCRMLKNTVLYHSVKYNMHSRNSYTAFYKSDGNLCCGHILFYLKCFKLCTCTVNLCNCEQDYLAVFRNIQPDNNSLFLKDNSDIIKPVLKSIITGSVKTNQYKAVRLDAIVGLGIQIDIGDKKVAVTQRPNTVECD